MIITLTGAYKNVGDHLIGHRGRQLLHKYVDADIINIDRKSITNHHYELFNKSKAIFLCGGPAYQENIYPNIYPLDLDRIKAPVIPFGLGYKAGLNDKFTFQPQAIQFITNIHSKIKTSSARDIKTVDVLKSNNISNVLMTGCPAWYDLEKMDAAYEKTPEIKSIAYSAPAKVDIHCIRVLEYLSKRFPHAKKFITFHHGIHTGNGKRELKQTLGNLKAAYNGLLNGYELVSLQKDLPKMMSFYNSCDLHVGYRVHAHLFCLSQKRASVLLSEDQRGISQSVTLNLPPILMNQSNYLDLIAKELDGLNDPYHFDSTFEKVKSTFNVMREFLEGCKD